MVKRFVETGKTDMREWSGGPWVRYSDYEALQSMLRDAFGNDPTKRQAAFDAAFWGQPDDSGEVK